MQRRWRNINETGFTGKAFDKYKPYCSNACEFFLMKSKLIQESTDTF